MMNGLSFFILSSALVLTNCQSPKPEKRPEPAVGGGHQNANNLTYQNHFRSWFQTNCNQCHGAGSNTFPQLDTLDKIRQSSSQVLSSVEQGRMPKSNRASGHAVANLRTWIQLGLPDYSGSGQNNNQGGSQITYDTHIRQYLEYNCTTCHGPGGTYPNLSTYDDARNAAQQSLSSMQQGRMPKGRQATQQDLTQFQQWINSGTLRSPNNNTGNNNFNNGQNITWQSHMQTWLTDKCGPCHTTGVNRPNLSTQYNAQQARHQILNSVQAGRMPPSTSGKFVSQQETTTLQQWVQAGAL